MKRKVYLVLTLICFAATKICAQVISGSCPNYSVGVIQGTPNACNSDWAPGMPPYLTITGSGSCCGYVTAISVSDDLGNNYDAGAGRFDGNTPTTSYVQRGPGNWAVTIHSYGTGEDCVLGPVTINPLPPINDPASFSYVVHPRQPGCKDATADITYHNSTDCWVSWGWQESNFSHCATPPDCNNPLCCGTINYPQVTANIPIDDFYGTQLTLCDYFGHCENIDIPANPNVEQGTFTVTGTNGVPGCSVSQIRVSYQNNFVCANTQPTVIISGRGQTSAILLPPSYTKTFSFFPSGTYFVRCLDYQTYNFQTNTYGIDVTTSLNLHISCDDGDPCTNDGVSNCTCQHVPHCPPSSDPCVTVSCDNGNCVTTPKCPPGNDPCIQISCDGSGNCISTNICNTWYLDADGDGYYSKSQQTSPPAGEAGWTQTQPAHGGGDCNDNPAPDDIGPRVYPGAPGGADATVIAAADCSHTISVGAFNYDCNQTFDLTSFSATKDDGTIVTAFETQDVNSNVVTGTYFNLANGHYTVTGCNHNGGCFTKNVVVTCTWYADNDRDGFGDMNDYGVQSETTIAGRVENNTDCDDNNPSINPHTLWYQDKDGDHYFGDTMRQCTKPDGIAWSRGAGIVSMKKDFCDDDPNRHPGLVDIPGDGFDADCDGFDGTAVYWVRDFDNDDWFSTDIPLSVAPPDAIHGWIVKPKLTFFKNYGDCNDSSSRINPGMPEDPNTPFDDNCDGFTGRYWYRDLDHDGWDTVVIADLPVGQTPGPEWSETPTGLNGVAVGTYLGCIPNNPTFDCNDHDPTRHPHATEICGDGIDQDCDCYDSKGSCMASLDPYIAPLPNKGIGCDNGAVLNVYFDFDNCFDSWKLECTFFEATGIEDGFMQAIAAKGEPVIKILPNIAGGGTTQIQFIAYPYSGFRTGSGLDFNCGLAKDTLRVVGTTACDGTMSLISKNVSQPGQSNGTATFHIIPVLPPCTDLFQTYMVKLSNLATGIVYTGNNSKQQSMNLPYNPDPTVVKVEGLPGGEYSVVGFFGASLCSLQMNHVIIQEGTITTQPLANNNILAPGIVDVSYTSNNITFDNDNQFIAELSGWDGLFVDGALNNTATAIGTLLCPSSSGTIHCHIPPDILPGSNYKIRVRSTKPGCTGSETGPITIGEATITTNHFAGGPYCPKRSVLGQPNFSVGFSTNATFGGPSPADQCNFAVAGNQFKIELSDANRDFSNPLVIGTEDGTSISTLIDAYISYRTMPPGTHYRFRVVSTNPPIVSSNDNGSDIEILDGLDRDGDGITLCASPPDCDDNDKDKYPGNTENCTDGKDNNCDGHIDANPCVKPTITSINTSSTGVTINWTGGECITGFSLLSTFRPAPNAPPSNGRRPPNPNSPCQSQNVSGNFNSNTTTASFSSCPGSYTGTLRSVCGTAQSDAAAFSFQICQGHAPCNPPVFKTDDEIETKSTEPVSNETGLKVYPNPFTDQLNFEFALPEDSRAKLEVFNVAGQREAVVFEGNVKAGELQKLEYTPLNGCNCLFIYRLQTESGTYWGKVVMER